MPIDKVPNAITWSGDHYTDNFSSISASDLISMPTYSSEALLTPTSSLQWGNESDNLIRNAKILYSVVYLGNYELDHQEKAGSHLAVDIRVPQGTPVQSVANGRVVVVSKKTTGFGHYIVIEHPNVPDYPDSNKTTTLYSTYNHLGDIKVSEGAIVEKGQVIALSGNTGTSTTPHLHFQIDRATAPWHPYWPFTSSEASSAGYSFFEAINNGLNMSKAEQHTVNPMKWVQAHLNESSTTSGNTNSDNNEEDEETPKLAKFKISTDKETAFVEEKISVTVTAYDQENDVFEDYKPSDDFKISSDSGSSRYLRSLDFEDGKATFTFTDIKTKKVTLTIQDSDVEKNVELTFEEAPVLEPDEFNILVSRLSVEQGDKVGIIVEALNMGEKIDNYEPSAELKFTINDNAVPLKFSQGVGDLTFIADKVGETEIKVSENDIEESLILKVTEKSEVTGTGSNVNNDESENEESNETSNENTNESSSGSDVVNENNEEKENNEEEEVEIETEEYSFEIIGENLGLVGNPITLVVKVKNDEGGVIKDFKTNKSIPVSTTGVGILQPENLDTDDFTNGVATVTYVSDVEEEIEIKIGEEIFEIGFITEIKQVAAFTVESDGDFIPELPETITIQAIDEDGNKTPDYTSIGKVKFSLIDGAGTFKPTELTASDFKGGKAEVIFTASSDGDVKIKAQN